MGSSEEKSSDLWSGGGGGGLASEGFEVFFFSMSFVVFPCLVSSA